MVQLIGQTTVRELSKEASQQPRLRKNLNFHANNEAQCHRLLNALEPGTYVQPHCHLDPHKEETLVVLSGRFGVLIFDATGAVTETAILAPQSEHFGITIPVGTFHSMVALESGSVFFEAKAGPYVPIAAEEKAHWAPAEGEPGCADYLNTMLRHFE
ncbi:WbuC family cupin fold metalloprotein [Undibacterium cyanobacteriorum]|uniref:WbuC family cupin fold metalloprotein n=1 Tax=Undibacterium cyanobacteriorum TaxID=3073561 RepID=A0ABY9RK75_9BURK|nr:WbuC family cupin fold metalloprotein [Undibacterium sp. 20NA77.5]WMW81602.1 WbuC family cupin fold metalloprotein [Undibacterium sp. 20NA77.5]